MNSKTAKHQVDDCCGCGNHHAKGERGEAPVPPKTDEKANISSSGNRPVGQTKRE